ncbi:ATP-binding cassette subfamily B protein [Actinocorallia herbida]|uniref:Fatty acid ABC transporter ATP-binding/permease protein n=1 Tax=Actinocorallia herbida TaxID=58109 RepID=A0A3N1D1D0_9ACTN|nr:ABC transporter ATP-binding protein [Actinocorallia herbida]ROO87337.1 ATP-binding cassette subfamily B protein [Actinocorallia herbida]
MSGTLRRVSGLLAAERPLIAGIIAAGAASVALTAAGPLLLGRATDLVVEGALAGGLDRGALAGVLLAACAVYAAAGLCAVVQARAANRAVQRVLRRLREAVQAKTARVPLRHFDAQPRGEVLSRATNDVDNLGTALQQALGQLVVPLFSVFAMLGVMFWLSWPLALFSLVTAPLSVLIAAKLAGRARPAYAGLWRHTGELTSRVEEALNGHALIRAYGRQEQIRARFEDGNAELVRSTRTAQALSTVIQPVMMFASNLNYLVIAVAGGLLVLSGGLTVGGVQAFFQYSRQYSQPFSQLAGMIGMVQSGLASAERVLALLDVPEQDPDPARPVRPDGPGRVVFERVSFGYSPDRPLLRGLDLVAEAGRTVAIVGPTGAGKTTLVNLLLRFHELDGGRITLDGADIARMTRADLRSRIGMVLQDTWLFGGTIAENIAYGAHGATRDQVVAAARAAHADRFVRTLPDGYDTRLDDEGSSLSAGEMQLLAIARAFLADPAILVLDEATSSVDTRTESLVQEAMARLRAGRTAFVIAHRLSTIRDADTIVVLRDGAVAEQGGHDELLAAGGLYASLYAAQFAAP